MRRLPPLLWKRLKEDLAGYLVEKGLGSFTLISWFHRQFKEAAEDEYLSGEALYIRHSSIFLPLHLYSPHLSFLFYAAWHAIESWLNISMGLWELPTVSSHHSPSATHKSSLTTTKSPLCPTTKPSSILPSSTPPSTTWNSSRIRFARTCLRSLFVTTSLPSLSFRFVPF